MARLRRIAERALGGVLVGWGAYAVICWSRYGRNRAATQDREDPLDAFIADPEIDEQHETRVRAPATVALKTLHELDVNRSPLVWLIFSLRTLPTRLRGGPLQWEYKGLVDQMLAIGWGVLADIPGRLFVAGAVTQPWETDVQFRALPPHEFERFDEPGYVKIVWTLEADELPSGHESIARTRIRVKTRPDCKTTLPALLGDPLARHHPGPLRDRPTRAARDQAFEAPIARRLTAASAVGEGCSRDWCWPPGPRLRSRLSAL